MIAAIILAAGNSTRMGSTKALLMYRGSTFLATIVGAVKDAALDPIIVVVGRDNGKILQDRSLAGVVVAENKRPEGGPIESIWLAIEKINRKVDGALVWPVDQPHISARTLTRLVGEFERRRPAMAVPTIGGRRGHPVMVGNGLFDEIGAAALAGKTLRDVMRADGSRVLAVEVDDPAILQDIDTPDDIRWLDA